MSPSRHEPVHPRGHAGGYPLAPWIIIGTLAAATGLSWLAWAAGQVTGWATGTPRTGPGFGDEFLAALLRGRWDILWPGLQPGPVGALWLVLVATVLVPACWGLAWWRARRPQAGDPLPSLARPADIPELHPAAAARRAVRLRPSLAGTRTRKLPAAEIGVPVGRLVTTGRRRRLVLHASWEDVLLAVMAPRAGKTTALAVPPILQAPGPVIATSNKTDLWAATTGARADTGTVWLFDPQRITHTRQAFWWNPLAAVTSVQEASRLSDHFVQEIRTPGVGDVFWPLAAADLLTCLFLAAAHSGGTLADVQAWLSDTTSREPVTLLRAAGFPQAARALLGRQNGAPETRDGVYETARTAARCLADPDIMAWVTPPAGDVPLPRFDARSFPTGTDTLYLLSKEGAGAAAPLVAALTDQSFRAAIGHAEAAGGRIDPPLLAVLDEAANICKIADLPQLYSHLGGRGIIPITIIQNYAQGTSVWGERGMAALWSASTVKLIGAGLDDARHAEDISRLIGEHDVAVASMTRDAGGYASWSTSVHRRRIMDPGQLRAIHRGQALLLATGAKPALVELQPWYTSDRATRTAAELATAIDEITTQARAELEQDPP
jgi:type IV secretory pathway TraG/TraD family ATPase VirD4